MKKEKTFCHACGQPTDKHKHSIARMLVSILLAVRGFQTEFHLQKDTPLTKNQYNNFQKLKYWGLVSNEGYKVGYWHITLTGRKFLDGEISIPRWVKTFNNRVVEQSAENIFIGDVKGISISYKKRPEYVADREPVNSQDLFNRS